MALVTSPTRLTHSSKLPLLRLGELLMLDWRFAYTQDRYFYKRPAGTQRIVFRKLKHEQFFKLVMKGRW